MLQAVLAAPAEYMVLLVVLGAIALWAFYAIAEEVLRLGYRKRLRAAHHHATIARRIGNIRAMDEAIRIEAAQALSASGSMRPGYLSLFRPALQRRPAPVIAAE